MTNIIKNEADLDKQLAAGASVFILFYSQWCPYCIAFLPSYEKRAKAAPDSFLRVCIDDMPDAEDKYAIDVVPTVLSFRKGKVDKRLDGKLGAGLTETHLSAFIISCGFPDKNKL
ncbi:MAG: thioredoxin family protein [Elusimicrobiota bacterium]